MLKMTSIEDHDIDIQSKNLNRFIAKLYRIVNSHDPTVRWVPGGKRFLILDPKRFAETVLPKYFKHSKFTSFVRQLNFYGFHKKRIVSSDFEKNENDGGSDPKLSSMGGDMVCFQHHFFQAKQPELLHRIQRTTKQTAAAAVAESESLSKQKEIEDIQAQLREMKKQMESSRDEFDIKLAAARAEIELDYLHRIRAIEVCYSDLVKMILPNKQLSDFPLPSLNGQNVNLPSLNNQNVNGNFGSVSRSSSTGSRSAANRRNSTTTSILLGQSYSPRDYLVEQKLGMLSQNNGGRRGFYGDLGGLAGGFNVDALVGAAQQRLLPNKSKEMMFAKKMNDAMAGRASLKEMLQRNRQMLAAFTTTNAAA